MKAPDRVHRSWVGRGRYPGLKPFVFGTIVIDAAAKDHEVRQELDRLWSLMMPLAPPDYEPEPGALFYATEEASR